MIQEKEIKVVISPKRVDQIDNEALVLFLSEDGSLFGESAELVDQRLNGIISQSIRRGEIKGMCGEIVLVASEGRIPSSKILLLGLGELSSFTYEGLKGVATRAFHTLVRMRVSDFGTSLPVTAISNHDYSLVVERFVEGIVLGLISTVGPAEIILTLVGEDKREKETILGLSRVKNAYSNDVDVLIVKGEPEDVSTQSN
ncbi:MAG: M17 family peptidase N-terminal domain-containing protein [Pseudomonadota bacterium]